MRAPCLAVLLCLSCGGFVPVTEAGPSSVSGCLVDADLAPRSNVSVFIVKDSVPVASQHTDQRGCFRIGDVPSGRIVVVANDFRGFGLVEPFALYAGQPLELGSRVVEALAPKTPLYSMQGVGFAERTLSGAWVSQVCRNGQLRLRNEKYEQLVIDAKTGANAPTTPLLVTPSVEQRQTGEPSFIKSLAWSDGTRVPLPAGFDCWTAAINQYGFVAQPGKLQPPDTRGGSLCATPWGRWLIGAVNRTVIEINSSPWLLDDGTAVAVVWSENRQTSEILTVRNGTQHLRPHLQAEPDRRLGAWSDFVESDWASTVAALQHDGVERLTLTRTTFDGQRHEETLVTGPPGHVIRYQADQSTKSITWITGTLLDNQDFLTSDGDTWGVLDVATGARAVLPAPPVTADGWQQTFPDVLAKGMALASHGARHASFLRWKQSPDGGSIFELIEHLGDRLRTRRISLPPRQQPNWDSSLLSRWAPSLAFLPADDIGLEIWSVDKARHLLLGAGRDPSEARPFMFFSAGWPSLVCTVGSSLAVNASNALGLGSTGFRYDIDLIATELGLAR